MSQFATRQVTRVQSSTWCVALVWCWCFSRWAQRRGRSQQQPWRGLYISASGLYIFRSQHVQVNIPSISCLSSSEPPIHRSGLTLYSDKAEVFTGNSDTTETAYSGCTPTQRKGASLTVFIQMMMIMINSLCRYFWRFGTCCWHREPHKTAIFLGCYCPRKKRVYCLRWYWSPGHLRGIRPLGNNFLLSLHKNACEHNPRP